VVNKKIFIFLVPIVGAVFYFIWTYNIFEQRKHAGWLALIPILSIIPILGILACLAFLIIIGFVAWKDRSWLASTEDSKGEGGS